MKTPMLIGITGGIGSGKSTLSDKLRAEGFVVYDSDVEARRLQNEHPVIRKQLIKLFGEDIYTPHGLNRPALAQLVFGQKDLLAQLNAIVHPVVKADLEHWKRLHIRQQLLFMESAILFESGFDKLVDKVIVMTAAEDVRIRRVVRRDSVTEEQVKARIANQMSDDLKIQKADFVIHTDDCQPLQIKMLKVLRELLTVSS